MWVDHALRSRAHTFSKAAAVGESEGEQLPSYPGTLLWEDEGLMERTKTHEMSYSFFHV